MIPIINGKDAGSILLSPDLLTLFKTALRIPQICAYTGGQEEEMYTDLPCPCCSLKWSHRKCDKNVTDSEQLSVLHGKGTL